MPVILQSTQSATTTDVNGLASIVPSSAGFSPPLEVDVRVAGANGVLDFLLRLLPAPPTGNTSQTVPLGARSLQSRILRAPGTQD
jgi:hypothetical protein